MTDTETGRRAKRLLRAMNDVNDIYIEEALRFGKDARTQNTESKRDQAADRNKTITNFPKIRRWTGILTAAAVCFIVVMVGARVADPNRTADTETQNSPNDQAVNPYEEVGNMAEAEAITGFGMEIPDAEDPYTTISISVIDKTMIEVSYCTQDGTEVGYSIRKATGSDDISGDYCDYAETKTEKTAGVTVTLKGNGGTWSVATWTSGGYSYAVNAAEHPLTENGMLGIVEQVR